MTVQEQLRALLQRHCTTINNQVDAIGRSLSQAGEPGADQAASIESALAIVHQIKGTSGSMGYREVSALAATLEQSLKGLEKLAGEITADQLQPSLDLLGRLEHIARNTTPEMSTLYDADLSRLTT